MNLRGRRRGCRDVGGAGISSTVGGRGGSAGGAVNMVKGYFCTYVTLFDFTISSSEVVITNCSVTMTEISAHFILTESIV